MEIPVNTSLLLKMFINKQVVLCKKEAGEKRAVIGNPGKHIASKEWTAGYGESVDQGTE